jgi:hypothetical protein
MGDGSQRLQSQAGLEVFLHVLGAGAELRWGERAIPPAREWVGRQDVPEQVDGPMTGARSARFCALRSDDTDARTGVASGPLAAGSALVLPHPVHF